MLLSVGIPFHNNARTLADAIRSVFAQTLTEWELILVDDGSSDGSLDIASSVADPRVKVIGSDGNQGLARRLNQIALVAQGRYIARMDADDLMHPERLARQADYLGRTPEVALVGTGAFVIDDRNRVVGLRGMGPLDTRPAACLKGGLFIHPTVTGRTEWFRHNPYCESLLRSQDRELWCRTLRTSVFSKLCEPLLFYRGVGTFNLSTYRLNCRLNRRILTEYGPSMVGWPLTVLRLGRSGLQEAAYRVVSAAGLQDALTRRRNQPIGNIEWTSATRAISTVLQTSVPGLPDRSNGGDLL